ncbi:MAG: FHA domain-containing protein [Planctomycetia bacterium]|nr:FHA domain-containing protein [Planctomycetia bacterium]
MAALIILTGKHQGKRLTVPDGEVVIGRDETCQVRLATNEVSRFHCRIRTIAQRVTVSDMGSRNGTLINDVAIKGEAELSPGDILRIGPVSFQLVGKKVESPNSEKKSPSDDSILDWLADEEESQTGDTTIIPRTAAQVRVPEPSVSVDKDLSPEAPPPAQKKYKSVGDEGEDIIQRHFELVQDGKLPKRVPALKPR